MIHYVNFALTWILFLALFPMSFFWLRRAYRIFVNKDYREVALKRGQSPAHPEKYAFREGLFSLLGGMMLVVVILGIVLWQLPYDTWTAMAGSTVVCKLFANFALSWQAHRKNNKPKTT